MAYKGDPEKDLMCQYFNWDKKTISLASLLDGLENAYNNVVRNNKNPKDVPVVIKFDNLTYAIPWYGFGLGIGTNGFSAFIESGNYHKIMPIPNDERPVEGEYWRSRGPSDFDVSGFVKSKAAGERLRRMVRLVLEKDEIKSWLDWRETEPEWIQFKFSAEEFDVEKLHKLSEEYDGVITLRTLNECKK